MHWLTTIWSFEYALVPCLVAYFVFDFPILIRRATRKMYVPIYFAFFPFGFSDELYARYFDEDNFWVVGGPFQADQRKFARMKIIWLSILSLVATMAISPFVAALFSHFFLDDQQFIQFLWTLGLMKGLLLLKSLYDLRWSYRIVDVVPIQYIALLYALYWFVIIVFLTRSKAWIDEKISEGGITLMLNSIIDFIVFNIGVEILFVAIVGWLVTWRLTAAYAESENEDA